MENQTNNFQDKEVLTHKIGKCLSTSMKSTDYFVGFSTFNFDFVIEEFKGETIFSEKISPLEQAIVGILLIDQSDSIERIGSILGFNVIQDKAEYAILHNALNMLLRHNVIEGDESLYCLTEQGKVFAHEGKRPERTSYSFKLWYNKQYPQLTSIKDILDPSNIIEGEHRTVLQSDVDLEIIKQVAFSQAPRVHNPNDDRILVEATLQNSTSYSYKLYVCFLRDILNGNVKAIVYDDAKDSILEDFSNLIENDELLKASLFDAIEETVFIPEEAQVNDIEKIDTEEGNDIEIEVLDGQQIQKLHKKALYDEILFENELTQIFTKDQPDEIWLISPWIGYFFVTCRVPMIENILNKGTKVFIAYSKNDPRDKNHSEMVHPLAQKEIDRLTENYSNFYCIEMPKIFHTKNVFEVKGEQIIMFSGSFNILSFAIQESHKIIRGEQMAFVNPQKAKSEYKAYIETFSSVLVNDIKTRLNKEESFSYSSNLVDKLKYLSSVQGSNSQIEDILDLIDDKYADFQKNEWVTRVHAVQKMISPLLAKGIVTLADKNYLRKELSSLEESASLLDLDDEMRKTLSILQDHFSNLKVRKTAEKLVDSEGNTVSSDISFDFISDIEQMYQQRGSGQISPNNLKTAKNVIRYKKISNDNQVIRYVASLNLLQAACKKRVEGALRFQDINTAVLYLIENIQEKCPNLSIFIDGDLTILDIAGIQVSFMKIPHTNNSLTVIETRNNIVSENKKGKLYLYADELFNIVFKRE